MKEILDDGLANGMSGRERTRVWLREMAEVVVMENRKLNKVVLLEIELKEYQMLAEG